MDKKMIKYMLITFGCAIFALILIAINSTRETTSVGLLAIIGISFSVSLVAAVIFVLLFIGKRKVLGPGSQTKEKAGTEMP